MSNKTRNPSDILASRYTYKEAIKFETIKKIHYISPNSLIN